MSRFDENLFSRITLINGYVTREQLDECMREQHDGGGRTPLGSILRDRGYLSDEQLEDILAIRRKKIRKYLRNPKETRECDKSFGQLAISIGNVSYDDLEDALLEQERLARLNLSFRLGEILVARGVMTVDTVLEILAKQGKRILVCPRCDCHFNAVDYDPTATYRCLKCQGELASPLYLDNVAVDALI